MPPTLHIRLLAEFRLFADDQPLDFFNKPSQQALLAFLLLQRHAPQPRQKIAFAFWPDSTEKQAYTNLRKLFYLLRQSLPNADDFLVADYFTIGWRQDAAYTCDVVALEQALDQVERNPAPVPTVIEQVLALYQGEVLPTCYSEWILPIRHALHERVINTLTHALSGLEAQQEYQIGLRTAEHLRRLEPLYEDAYRHLMHLRARSGDLTGALRVYQECAALLAQELDIAPAAETQALYAHLLKAKPTADTTALRQELVSNGGVSPRTISLPSTSTTATTSTVTSGSFQGCQQELAALHSSFVQAITGQMSLVFVRGESGIGKTQLVDEFMRQIAEKQSLLCLQGRCYAAEQSAPYTMWSDALSRLVAADRQPLLQDLPDVWRQQFARLVPGLASSPDATVDLAAADNQLRLLQGIVQGLRHIAQTHPLIIFFDDIHWADVASLELLHYASRHLIAAPILFIGAYSPEVATDNLALQTILRETSPPTIEVTPIDATGVSAWLDQLNVAISPQLALRLHQHCGGNRFMLIETIRVLLDEGKLDQTAGDLPLPQRVQALIQARMATLSDMNRRLLAAAAVIGRSCDLILLRQVSGQPEMEMLGQVDDLLKRAFLREVNEEPGQEALAISHTLIRQVAYHGQSRSQRQALHRRTAEALSTLHPPQMVTEEIAYHYEQAAHPEAMKYLRQAVQQAETLYALPHATDLTTRALAFQAKYLDDQPGQRFELLLTRESLLDQQARRAEQLEDIMALLQLANTLDDPQWLALAYVRQAGYLSSTRQPTQSHKVAEKALKLYRKIGDKAGEAKALRELGFLYWFTNNYGMALEYERSALQLHRQLGDLSGEATALHNLAEIYHGLNSPRQALAHYDQALALQWARQDYRRQGLTLYGIAHTLRLMGDRTAARDRYEQALTQTESAGDKLMTSRVHHALGSLMAQDRQNEAALEHLQRAVKISEAIGFAPGMAHGLVGLSYMYALTAQSHAARDALHDALNWFQLMEDPVGIEVASTRIKHLNQDPTSMTEPPPQMGWIKGHVVLNEGKIYCQFESPVAKKNQGN